MTGVALLPRCAARQVFHTVDYLNPLPHSRPAACLLAMERRDRDRQLRKVCHWARPCMTDCPCRALKLARPPSTPRENSCNGPRLHMVHHRTRTPRSVHTAAWRAYPQQYWLTSIGTLTSQEIRCQREGTWVWTQDCAAHSKPFSINSNAHPASIATPRGSAVSSTCIRGEWIAQHWLQLSPSGATPKKNIAPGVFSRM